MQSDLFSKHQNSQKTPGSLGLDLFNFIFYLQFVDDANITINEVKKFREQKMRKLKEQLEKKKTQNISSSFDPSQVRKEQILNGFFN